MNRLTHGEVDTSTWTTDQIRQANIFHLAIYQQMIVNDTAAMAFYDLLEELGGHPGILRGGVKRWANNLRRRLREYNAYTARRHPDSGKFVTELLEWFEERTAPQRAVLEQTMRNLWNRMRSDDPALMTRVLMADTWAVGMVRNADKVREQMSGMLDRPLLRAVEEEKQKRLADAVAKLTDEIGRSRHERLGDKEASDYWAERCREGVKAVMRVLSDPRNIYEGCKAVGLTDDNK